MKTVTPTPTPTPTPKIKPIGEMTSYELDKEYKRRRIESIKVRTMAYRLDLARIRESLIEKKLVERQLTFMLIAMRQRVLAIPNSYARKLLHKSELQQTMTILNEMVGRLLNDLADLPRNVTDPNWLLTLEEEEGERHG
jgi:hypothetical protein